MTVSISESLRKDLLGLLTPVQWSILKGSFDNIVFRTDSIENVYQIKMFFNNLMDEEFKKQLPQPKAQQPAQ